MWLPSSSFRVPAVALLAWSTLVGNAAAQVTTDCFPMNKTCPPNPAFGMDVNFNFNMTPNPEVWKSMNGPITWDADDGANFRITKQGESPKIESKFYYFWGRTEVHLKVAKGQGIISSIMMLSDNLDEVDWEFFGNKPNIAQSNYYGKGYVPDVPKEPTQAEYHDVPFNVLDDYHNYTTDWTKDYLDFYVDGNKVRRLTPKDANDTYNYPQTPMRLSIGIWAGGDPTMPPGTREWAGGDTDFKQTPFEMFVKSAHVTDYSSGKEYEYTDKTGSWESIKIIQGNSTVKEVINAPPEKSLSDKWNDLPEGAKIAVYAGASGFVGLLLVAAMVYCIRQRRRGAREAKLAEARAEAERMELERFKKAGIDPDSFASTATEYNAKEMRRDGFSDQDSYSVPSSPNLNATTPASPLDNTNSAAGMGAGAGAAAAAAGAGVGLGLAAGAATSAMRSPPPHLRDGAQSPRVGSPGPGGPAGFYADRSGNNRTPAPSRHAQSPASSQRMMSPGPGQRMMSPAPTLDSHSTGMAYGQPPARSFTSPNPQMRVGSPGTQQQHAFGGGGDIQRVGSPAQLAHPQPQRSFTTDGYGGSGQGMAQGRGFNDHQSQGWGGQGHEQDQEFGSGGGYGQGGAGSNQGYGNGGYGNGGGGNQGYWGR